LLPLLPLLLLLVVVVLLLQQMAAELLLLAPWLMGCWHMDTWDWQ
jgi:hypothetical protein